MPRHTFSPRPSSMRRLSVRRPRADSALLATLVARATRRDRWLLSMLHTHRVLTTPQITRLAFTNPRLASLRLGVLYRLRAVDRFRPYRPVGSAPWHYVLDEAGARLLASLYGVEVAELGFRRDRALDLCASPRLTHDTGVADVATWLVAYARTYPGHRLSAWWPERTCTRLWGRHARPDAYLRWTFHDPAGVPDDRQEVDVFLEYDTGSEPLHQVADKLAGYQDLAEATGIATPVAFWLPNPTREHHLHQTLGRPAIPVLTAAPSPGARPDTWNPAGPVWALAGRPGSRLRLLDLAPTTGTGPGHPAGTGPGVPTAPDLGPVDADDDTGWLPDGPDQPPAPMPPRLEGGRS